MNTEQLKQLKPGDEILIRARYKAILGDGDVLISHSSTGFFDAVIEAKACTRSSNVILPPPAPKYDPCRLFKKGDTVRIVSYKCRKLTSHGSLATVEADEWGNNLVLLVDDHGDHLSVNAAYLELVTPVEELEPYSVAESSDYFSVDKGEEELCTFWKDSHPHAKEGAEAECARLNAEYRKGQA